MHWTCQVNVSNVFYYLCVAPTPSATLTPAAPTTPPPMPKVTIVTEDKTIAIKGYKRTMVKTMTQSGGIPQFGYCDEINMDALVR